MLEVDISGLSGPVPIRANFRAPDGVTSLFGQSGAGKSTITNMIAGILRPQQGRILVNDTVLFDSEKGIDLSVRARHIGHVFQDARLFPHFSVLSNLTFSRWAGRRSGEHSVTEIVNLLGLEKLLERYPSTLSGGEKQRVAIGRALLSAPRLLIMDEPLASLDQGRKADILPYLDQLQGALGIPIIYVSHAMEEVARLSRTLVIVSEGKTIAHGPVAEVLSRLDLGYTTGRHEAGSLLEGRVLDFDEQWGLARVGLDSGNTMQVPALRVGAGEQIRMRIRARDVAVALKRVDGLSIRNTLQAQVLEINNEDGPYTEILCSVGNQNLRARITRASAMELKLESGMSVFLLIKSVAIDRRHRKPLGIKPLNPGLEEAKNGQTSP